MTSLVEMQLNTFNTIYACKDILKSNHLDLNMNSTDTFNVFNVHTQKNVIMAESIGELWGFCQGIIYKHE